MVLGLTIRATLADANRRDPDWRIYSLWIATSIMLSPVGWHHYLVLLTIPFVQLVASAADGRSSSRAVWMAALAYVLSAVSLRVFNRFLIPPPTDFQRAFPWLVRALEETSFIALLTGYIAAYWFATDRARQVVSQFGVALPPQVTHGSVGGSGDGHAGTVAASRLRADRDHAAQLYDRR